MSSIVYFQYITGTIHLNLEVATDSGAPETVKVGVNADNFRKFWPMADSLCWDPEAGKFLPRYNSHFMAASVENSDRALLAFAAGQYYLRMEPKEEREDPDADLHPLELESLRKALARAKLRKVDLVKEQARLTKCLTAYADRENKLKLEKAHLDECLQNSIAHENKLAETNRQLQLRIQDLEAELASQKALREELDRSLDGSIQNANNQHKLACEAREQLAKAREEAEFYRIGMQKVAAIANSKPLEDS
ncbi:phage capsid and scaffold [Pseudomonas phage S12-3]|uniref:Capsid and scaffold protein n=3 Tax=Pbunavirus TaxID=1198980 RepID=A0A8T8BEL4_9CAUD|nr:hypothetical protein [Pseudomonas phage vB_PA6_GUMS]BAU16505.1 Phage capsid and scaffold [Pseudomonas phage S12-1]BBJ26884.1 phage capsid and scaffold [Pseudomonas phage S12-3]